MVTVNMDVVNFYQPHKRKEEFIQPNNRRISDNTRLISSGSNGEDGSGFLAVKSLLSHKLSTDIAPARPSRFARLNDREKLESSHQVQNEESGSTEENPIVVASDSDDDDNEEEEEEEEIQSSIGDINCITTEKPRKNHPFGKSASRLQSPLLPPNVLNQGQPESTLFSAGLSPSGLPAQSIDEAKQHSPSRTPEVLALEDLTSFLNGELSTPLTVQSPLYINEEYPTGEHLEGERQTIELVSDPQVGDLRREKRRSQDDTQETANDTQRPDRGDYSNSFREESDDSQEDLRPPMKYRKKSLGHDATTPHCEDRSWHRSSVTSDKVHLSIASEALSEPRQDKLSSTSETLGSPSAMREPIPTAEYQEWPLEGCFKCTTIRDEIIYNVTFTLPRISGCVSLPINPTIFSIPSGGSTSTSLTSIHGARSQLSAYSRTKSAKPKHGKWTSKEDKTTRRVRANKQPKSNKHSRGHERKHNCGSADKPDEYEVKEILDARVKCDTLQYRVEWCGYEYDPEWYPASNFKNSPHKLRDFHDANPSLPGPPKRLVLWIQRWGEEGDIDDHSDDNKPEG